MKNYLLLILLINQVGVAQNWEHLGPFNPPATTIKPNQMDLNGMGWVESLWFEKSQMVAGSRSGGLYKSSDFGETWHPFLHNFLFEGVQDIIHHKDIWTMATGSITAIQNFGSGIYIYNENSGEWINHQLPNGKSLMTRKLLRSKENGRYFACSENGIYAFNENEISLIHSEENLNLMHFAQNPKYIYVSGKQLFRMNHLGTNLENLTNRLSVFKNDVNNKISLKRIGIAVDPSNKGKIFAAYESPRGKRLDVSYDNGNTWHFLSTLKIRRMDENHLEISVAPDDSSTVYIGAVSVFKSIDGGKNFNQISNLAHAHPQFIHADVRELWVQNKDTVLVANDGGVSITTDGGQFWEDRSTGLSITEIYGIDIAKDGTVFMGCQDLGNLMYKNSKWYSLGQLYGDGGIPMIYPNNDSLVFLFQNRNLFTYDFKNHRYKYVGIAGNSKRFDVPMIYNSQRNQLIVGQEQIYLSNLDSIYWNQTTHLSGEVMHAIADIKCAPSNNDIVYFGSISPSWNPKDVKNVLFKSYDGGHTWIDISENLPLLAWRGIGSIAINPNDENHIVLSFRFANFDNGHICYESYDGGNTWSDLSFNLPHFSTKKVLFAPDGHLILGSIKGVYQLNKEQSFWRAIHPTVLGFNVTDLKFNAEGTYLYVATFGNGLWRYQWK